MASERFVVLGLAHARSEWFRALGSWANSGALPVELVKCVSAAEVRARLGSGRQFSALVADAGLPSVDRDLVSAARHRGCTVIVVDDARVSRDWQALGAAAVLDNAFGRDDLLAVLWDHATMIGRGEAGSDDLLARPSVELSWRAPVVALTGAGGTGTSTATIALAQALGGDVRHGGMVLLADLRLHAEQAMLHDARDLVPSVQELVEAHRSGQPTLDTVRALAFDVEERRYRLLLGLGRARFWAAIRPEAFAAAFDSLRRAFRVVVCDTDSDLEGEEAGGSIDVEERHTMARTAVSEADVVFAVGLPSMKGLHSLVRVVCELLTAGVPEGRIVPVVNRAPTSPRSRAAIAATIADLLTPSLPGIAAEPSYHRRSERVSEAAGTASPIFLPERPVEKALRDGTRLPAALGAPLAGAFHAVCNRSGAGVAKDKASATGSPAGPERVRPGSMGRWADEAAG